MTKAVSDCHVNGVTLCTAVQYLDANWIYAQGSVPGVQAASSENWWQHDPGQPATAANRIAISSYGGGNLLNQSNPAVDAWFDNYVHSNYNAYDALMMDDSSGSLSNELWGSGFSTSDELTSDSALQASHEQMAASITHTNGTPFMQIDNALSANDNLSTPFAQLGNPSTVVGVITEGAPMYDGTMTGYYSSELDEMAYLDHTSNDFDVLLSYDTSGSQQARLVQAATILLGYSQGHTVSWSDLNTNSDDLAVWPEEGIVPTQPIQTMGAPTGVDCLAGQGITCSNGGHNDLQVATGVYRREFAQCYDQGTKFGDCAALVNTTSSPITVPSTWLTQSYGHLITLNGSDLQAGGTVNLQGATFTPGQTTIPANDAILLAQ
ncbi:MAG: hypothetical protein ACLP01_30105 [Solirubrobacteraceae bacterium]